MKARNVGGWVLANLLILSGFVKQRRKKILREECIVAMCFHKPTRVEFEQCIKWLKKYQFQFLSIADVEKLITDQLPFPKGGVLLTVDDGWQTNEANIIEVANTYKVPVAIFVSTAPVEEGTYWWTYVSKAKQQGIHHASVSAMKKWPNEDRLEKIAEIRKVVTVERNALTSEQVKYAAQSPHVTIGGHTHTHPILIQCNDEQVYEELKVSKEKLEAWLGKDVRYFAYPNGDYGIREIKALKSLQYTLAFTSTPDYIVPESLKYPYELPRFMFLEGASFAENICRMVGVWKSVIKKLNACFRGSRRPVV